MAAESRGMSEYDMRSAFNLFDRKGEGKLKIDFLETLVRACGLTPSAEQIALMEREIDIDNTGEFNVNGLLVLVESRQENTVTSQEEVIQAFQVFDRDGKGTINVQELRQTMSNLGERLTEDEVNGMIKDADPEGSGEVDYVQFVKKMSEGLC